MPRCYSRERPDAVGTAGEDNTALPRVTITTDGAARGNPGPGGWAALLEDEQGRERLLTGQSDGQTTNNAMELMAVVRALQALKRPCQVLLRCDSEYVLGGLRRLLKGESMAQAKFNVDIWVELEAALKPHRIELEWVKGHSGDRRNEQVDQAANAAANRARQETQGSAPLWDHDWLIAFRSRESGTKIAWMLRSPHGIEQGVTEGQGQTELTNLYRALLTALRRAQQSPGSAEARLLVVSSQETLVKQGRGEWKVKQPAQQPLAAEAVSLRAAFAGVEFAWRPTDEIEALMKMR